MALLPAVEPEPGAKGRREGPVATGARPAEARDEELNFWRRADLSDLPNGELSWDGVFMEYRYDALGRRVFVRTRRDNAELCSIGSAPCDSHIDRFVWDGDQLLMEQRSSVASWRYVHGLGIDRPLSQLTTAGEAVYPHVNWQGQPFTASAPNGAEYCSGGGAPCPIIDWAGLNRRTHFRRPEFERIGYDWYGSLITGGSDPSELLFMRSRYYDPESGAFTQADPIGLAGGMNLYGYANGDPVNFWDPFGLCPEWLGGSGETRGLADCPEGSIGFRMLQVGGVVGAGAQAAKDGLQCGTSAGIFSSVLVADATTLGVGAGLLRVGFRLAGSTLSHGLATSLRVASRSYGENVLATSNAVIGSMASTGTSYAVGVPVAAGADLAEGSGLSLGIFVPFSGTTDRFWAVARDCG